MSGSRISAERGRQRPWPRNSHQERAREDQGRRRRPDRHREQAGQREPRRGAHRSARVWPGVHAPPIHPPHSPAPFTRPIHPPMIRRAMCHPAFRQGAHFARRQADRIAECAHPSSTLPSGTRDAIRRSGKARRDETRGTEGGHGDERDLGKDPGRYRSRYVSPRRGRSRGAERAEPEPRAPGAVADRRGAVRAMGRIRPRRPDPDRGRRRVDAGRLAGRDRGRAAATPDDPGGQRTGPAGLSRGPGPDGCSSPI